MKILALLMLGSLLTAALLSLGFLVFRPVSTRNPPVVWVSLLSAALWSPFYFVPPLLVSYAKGDEPIPPAVWPVAVMVLSGAFGVWAMVCSIAVRATKYVYGRMQNGNSGSD